MPHARRIARWSAALLSLPLLLGLGAGRSSGDPGPAETAPARVELTGTLLHLADEHDTSHAEKTLLQLPDAGVVPLAGDALAGQASGTQVRTTVLVPPGVVAAARTAAGVPVTGGTVRLDADELARARRGTPAAADTGIGRATTAEATRTGTSLTVTDLVVTAAARTGSSTRVVHDLWVAVPRPTDTRAAAPTAARIRAQVAAASAYWSDQTGGRVTLAVHVIGAPYRSAYACRGGGSSLWSEAADRLGFDEAPDRHLVLALPQDAYAADGSKCSYGLASIGADADAGGVAYVTDTAWPVLAHEIGHNLGVDHARAVRCSRRTDVVLTHLPTSCSLTEYGYVWDVMAASAPDRAGSLSSPMAIRLGFLPTSDYRTVTTGTRTVTLVPLSSRSGVRAARVHDPASGDDYFVEYRTRTGRDKLLYAESPSGVRILRLDTRPTADPLQAGPHASVVLDPTPTGRADDNDRALAPGHTFTSWDGAVRVTVRSAASGAAVVQVKVGRS